MREAAQGVRIDVEVKLRASRTRVLGVKAERLCVALAAAPVDGAANRALIQALAAHFGVPRSQVRLVLGDKSRRKVVELRGISAAAAQALISNAAGE